MDAFIELKNVVKSYTMGDVTIYANNGVNFKVNKGEFTVIVGASGAGKTTILNMLGGMDTPTSGTILVDGHNIATYDDKQLTDYRRDDIGFVFQFYNLIPDLTVQENIEVVADISNNPLNINEVMEELGIASYKNRFPKELSGGQQQRVAIARALIKNPKILLCDELTGALDSKSSRDVLRVIEKINSSFKTTIIIITHNEAIAHMADTVVRIRDGKVADCIDNKQKMSADELEL